MSRNTGVGLRLLLGGSWRLAWARLRKKFYSDSCFILLRRDVLQDVDVPPARIPLSVRLLEPSDIEELFGMDGSEEDAAETFAKLDRKRFVESGIGTWYVGVSEGHPCFSECLMAPSERDEVDTWFRGYFPSLGPDEALMEGAYTPPAFRGKGVMPAVMAHVVDKATEAGARWVLTSCERGNVAALKGCLRVGFVPFLERHERRRLMMRRLESRPIGGEFTLPTASR